MTSTGHLLPFSINLEGSVNAESYMKIGPCDRSDQQHPTLPTLETHVRGRRLVGIDKKLPGSVQGAVWQQEITMNDENDQEEIHWEKLSAPTIANVVFWKKDYAPSDMDARLRAVDGWLDIANTIHEPLPL